VVKFLTEDQQIVCATGDAELFPLDAGKGLERGAGGAPAVGAVAVQGVAEGIGHAVLHLSTQASTEQYTVKRRWA